MHFHERLLLAGLREFSRHRSITWSPRYTWPWSSICKAAQSCPRSGIQLQIIWWRHVKLQLEYLCMQQLICIRLLITTWLELVFLFSLIGDSIFLHVFDEACNFFAASRHYILCVVPTQPSPDISIDPIYIYIYMLFFANNMCMPALANFIWFNVDIFFDLWSFSGIKHFQPIVWLWWKSIFTCFLRRNNIK